MSAAAPPIRIRRFLGIAGVFSAAVEAAFVLVWIGGLFEHWYTGKAETAANLLLMILPFLAGTGLLDTVRRGHLDLLVGAGTSRALIWRTAFLRAVAVPAALAVILSLSIASNTTTSSIAGMAFRALSAAALLGGVGFAAGMVGSRYVAGTLWIAARLVFILSGPGRRFLVTLGTGVEDVHPLTTAVALTAIPELLLDSRVPIVAGLAHLILGGLAILFSFYRLRRADFTGRRSE